MIKLNESAYVFDPKVVTLSIEGTSDNRLRTTCTLAELEAFIIQLQKTRLMMVVDEDKIVEKKLVETMKEPDDKMRAILLEEKELGGPG